MSKKILAFILAACMTLSMTACGGSDSSDAETQSSSFSETDSSENNSSETDSSKDESSETNSSKDESSEVEKVTTKTPKKVEDSSSEDDNSSKVTTTKKTETPKTTTTTKTTQTPVTQKPVVTTKTTTKQTTKATTKATTKITTSKIVKPSNLTRYEDALWEVMVNKNYSKTNTKYLEIIRQEAIKYAQNGWIKQYYDAVGGFEVNSKMYPFIKNGKPYYVYEKGIVNSNVEFDDMNPMGGCDTSSTEAAMSEVKSAIRSLDVMIAHQLANACRHGEPDIQWNLTYGLITEDGFTSIEWYCITGFASEWK
jgi:hypothetical protein